MFLTQSAGMHCDLINKALMTQWKMTPNPTAQRNSNCDSLDYDYDGSHCVINQWQVGRTAYGLNNTKGWGEGAFQSQSLQQRSKQGATRQ